MAPFATMILAVPAALLEGNGVFEWLHTHETLVPSLTIIFSSGVLAFCLNFSIFYVIHSTTAVTFNVAGNLKVIIIHDHLPCNVGSVIDICQLCGQVIIFGFINDTFLVLYA